MANAVQDILLYPLRIHADAPVIEELYSSIQQAIESVMTGERFKKLKRGSRIGITAGSRGIANYVPIMQSIVQVFKDKGYEPFLLSSMGTHGRGEPEGQREILDSLGITPEQMNCSVSYSSDVVVLGEMEAYGRTLPIYCAKDACEADAVLVVNRIKPHTSFHGDYESGLLKMITVGMGRVPGATMFHSLGAGLLREAIPLFGERLLELAPIVGGIGIVENANEQTAIIEGIPKENIFEREKKLLEEAKRLMPRLPMNQADICIVGEMGKNYSGTGMDTNIIGRLRIQGVAEPSAPQFTYIGVLRLSEPSHGNATGIGLADFTTEDLVNGIDKKATYLNCMTSGFVIRAAIPMTFPTDLELVAGAVQALHMEDVNSLRMVAIKNTLHIDHIWVTKAIYEEVKNLEHITLDGNPSAITFDSGGNWLWNAVK
ncbi:MULTISPECIES: DUF2088 domain-containing protein [unclassified Paenibacillus]|uniref:DUF2088 domain-containing protein n=1 Tax=unclassified Paenibacillus TaxID=185978 RepID=UPI001AEB1290|nr:MULTISPECIES: DUF2088 domain-containing protein [unclassified Paenibacillus]MBP1155853.1 hypothetical protein [Paenibacillus sp. PvP091]MBP1168761.1 hypothetical protein [Paenibacillus sp. PvR098]MBP2439789.1 hypothetical protein [Paenibacillus sp. PvP052]